MMSSESNWFVNFMIVLLIGIYVGSYYAPYYYGVKCDEDHAPYGLVALTVFYIVWTMVTYRLLKNDAMLDLKNKSWKNLYERTKQLSLKEFEGEYDHEGMVKAQREMYMITTVLNLVI